MPVLQRWRQLEGTVLDDRFRLGAPVEDDARVAYSVEAIDGSALPIDAIVRFLPERPGDELLQRYLEATFLNHPNLIRCYAAGSGSIDGEPFVYAVTEPEEERLADVLRRRPLSVDEARELGEQLVSGLAYLHARNLVCCNLDTGTVALAGNRWKIADFSQIRVAGNTNASETRRLLATSPAIPPEAFEGAVSPAWDVWSLASVLTAAVSGPKPEPAEGGGPGGRRLQVKRELPPPFDAVVSHCFAANPRQRCSLERISELLRSADAGNDSAPATFTAEPEPVVPVDPGVVDPGVRDAGRPTRPLETRFRVEDPPRGLPWLKILASIGAIAGGALIAALTLNSNHPETTPQPSAQVEAAKPNSAAEQIASKPSPSSGTAERDTPPKAGDDTAQIRTVLNDWIAAARSANADAQSTYYAPTVDTFYGSRHVSRDWIRRNKETILSNIGEIRDLSIQNVEVKVDRPGRAVVTLEKTWDFGGSRTGKVKQEIIMRKLDVGWRIVSERDTHVFRVQSGRRSRRA